MGLTCSPVPTCVGLIDTEQPSCIRLDRVIRSAVQGSDNPPSGRVNFVRSGGCISGQTGGDLA